MDRLEILPDQSGYGADTGDDILRAQFDGPSGRYRRHLSRNSFLVSCQWTLGPEEYMALCKFQKKQEKNTTLFIIKLITESSFPEDHYAAFVPKTFILKGQSGQSYNVSATLEAMLA